MPTLADLAPPGAPSAPAAASAAAPAPLTLPNPLDDVASGKLPGVRIPPLGKTPDPLQRFAVDNFDKILQAGLDFHETKHEETILFNPSVVSRKQVEEAEHKGTLDKLFPDVKAADRIVAAPAPQAAAPAGGLSAVSPPGTAAPTPIAAPAGGDKTPESISRARLATVQPKGKSPIVPNPIPDQLKQRPV